LITILFAGFGERTLGCFVFDSNGRQRPQARLLFA